MELKDVLHLYLGADCLIEKSDYHMVHNWMIHAGDKAVIDGKLLFHIHNVAEFKGIVKPILRKLSSMTEEEMIELLQSMVPGDMEDKPTAGDYDLEMFYNDNATMVDGDVAVGAEVTCICYIGQIAITYDGTIHQHGEDGELEKQSNVPQAYRYLLSKHFDLFNLIDSNLAIESTKPHNP